MEEKYFELKEKNEKPKFMNFPIILVLTNKGLEIITSKYQEELKNIGFRKDKEGNYLVNSDYFIRLISKEEAKKIIEQRDLERRCWGDYFNTSENISSSHLGFGEENLY